MLRRACIRWIAAGLVLLAAGGAEGKDLRVCADPNNLPFSNRKGEGFENRIVAIIASELAAEVRYTWWPARRGFLRNTLEAGRCDLVAGVPTTLETVRTTRPYYRSGYVFVMRAGEPAVASLDDPALRELRIGIQLVGADGANPPPAEALARRGLVRNLRGYTVYGDYRRPDPGEPIVAAVARREVDVAIVWGPLAGYYATRQAVPLAIAPVRPAFDGPRLPMVFNISMGVRLGDERLLDAVDAALANRRGEIDRTLAEYNVPRLDRPRSGGTAR